MQQRSTSYDPAHVREHWRLRGDRYDDHEPDLFDFKVVDYASGRYLGRLEDIQLFGPMEQVRQKLHGNQIIREHGRDPPMNRIHIYVQHGGLVQDFGKQVVDYRLDHGDTIWVSIGDEPILPRNTMTIQVYNLNNSDPDPWSSHLLDVGGLQPNDTVAKLARAIASRLYDEDFRGLATWKDIHNKMQELLRNFKIVFRTGNRNWVVFDYQKDLEDYGLVGHNNRVWIWQGADPIPERLHTTLLRDTRVVRFTRMRVS